MADQGKYKIKIEENRVLGPLDLQRVSDLIRKGRLTGKEPTAIEPFQDWKALSSFPELADLILKKIQSERTPAEGNAAAANPAIEQEAPTLVNVVYETNVDTEKTQVIAQPSPMELAENAPAILESRSVAKPTSGEATKMISLSDLAQTLEKAKTSVEINPQAAPDVTAEPIPEDKPKKKPLLSKNTALLLAFGILLITYFSNQEESAKPSNRVSEISPQVFKFPFVDVNAPAQQGKGPNAAAANDLMEEGIKAYMRDTPLGYIRAIKEYFYPAIGKNAGNWKARALLASSYIRIMEILPRDEQFFTSLKKLLLPGPPKGTWVPEYVVAISEYYMLLDRADQAMEILEEYNKSSPHPETLATMAQARLMQREPDQALAAISRAVSANKEEKVNTRHMRLYAEALERKGQKEPAKQAYEKILKSQANYGPAILALARQKFQAADYKSAAKTLLPILEKPEIVDRVQLGEAFLLTAKIFDAMRKMDQAEEFAEAARPLVISREEVDDFLLRLKAKDPDFEKAYGFIVSARQKEKSKEYDAAINLYIRAAEANSNDSAPVMLLGQLYKRIGKYDEAIDRFERATQYRRPPLRAFLELADLYIRRYDVEKAEIMLKRASEFKRQKDMVDFLRAKLKYRQGLKDVAEGLYKKIITSGSRLPELYVSAGELEAGKEDRELAEFYYAMALRYEPFNADAMLGIALARFYLERPSRAISFLKDKLLQQPNSASVMTNLAIVYQRANDLDAAKNYLSNAVKADRQYSMAFKLIGDLTKRQGDEQILVNPQQAEELYKYSLAAYGTYSQLAPTDPDGYVAVGDLYRVVNDLGNAAKSYNKVLKLAPTYPNIRIKLAKISINGGDMPKALQLINEEIKFNSNNANAYVVLGNIHLLKSEYVQAQKQFVQAARIDDKNIDAVMGLAQTLYLQGNLDGSVSLFERAAKLTPLNPQIYWNLALIYRRLNNRSLAIKALMDYKGLVKNRPNLISDADRIIAELQ